MAEQHRTRGRFGLTMLTGFSVWAIALAGTPALAGISPFMMETGWCSSAIGSPRAAFQGVNHSSASTDGWEPGGLCEAQAWSLANLAGPATRWQ
jgi:hypothetical protein